mmetsp:Transcript_34415/g.67276  ORF Transcript_34415/g.67276 Transcript_34415/m.67276 type:complete len:202 (-) Transcript_34415:181-786(-)
MRGIPGGSFTFAGPSSTGTVIFRLPPTRIPMMPCSSPSQVTLENGRWPYLNDNAFLNVWSAMVTSTFIAMSFPGPGWSLVLTGPRRRSSYLSPLSMVMISPLPGLGPSSNSAATISLPSVAPSSATTARPPTSPKRRETKLVAESTGSNWLKPAPDLSIVFFRSNCWLPLFLTSSAPAAALPSSAAFSSPSAIRSPTACRV